MPLFRALLALSSCTWDQGAPDGQPTATFSDESDTDTDTDSDTDTDTDSDTDTDADTDTDTDSDTDTDWTVPAYCAPDKLPKAPLAWDSMSGFTDAEDFTFDYEG